jgi:alkaline phosphatase
LAARPFVVLATALAPRFASAEVKNVILMISDGAGYNHWTAGSMYQGRWDAQRGRSTQVYDGDGWIEVACATYPLNLSETPLKTDVQNAELVYDPAKAWDPLAGYDWLKRTFTDSAAAGTALATGVKTYNSAINWSDLDRPISPTMPRSPNKPQVRGRGDQCPVVPRNAGQPGRRTSAETQRL